MTLGVTFIFNSLQEMCAECVVPENIYTPPMEGFLVCQAPASLWFILSFKNFIICLLVNFTL